MRILALLLAAAASLTGRAQEALAHQLRQQHEQSQVGTNAWFVSGCERVEAEVACDLAGAVAHAEALTTQCRRQGLTTATEVASALWQLALALHEGPARSVPADAAPDRETMPSPASPTPAERSRLLTAKARLAWLHNQPTEFIAHALPALAAARASGDDGLVVRAAWVLHTVTEREAPGFDAALRAEIAPLLANAALASFRPWADLNTLWATTGLADATRRRADLDAVVRAADAIGDLRTRIHAEWDRAVDHAAAEHHAEADAALATALAFATRLGDRRLLAVTHEVAAGFALDRGQLDLAATRLRDAEAAVATRGFPDRDVEQAHLRLRLATARNDDAASSHETRLLAGLRDREAARYRGYAPLRDELLAGEQQRLAAVAAQARADATLRLVVGLAVVATLSIATAMAWRSRNRLGRAHGELQRETARTAAANAAREQLEQRLQGLARADSLGALASGLSHEFNNLIAAVLGNAELLHADERDPGRRQQLETIVAAGQRGAALCRQLQSCSSEPAGAWATFDLTTLVRRLAPALGAAFGDDTALALDTDATPLLLAGKAAELEQAAVHLVANARDAKARRVHVRATAVTMPAPPWPGVRVRGEPHAGRFACLEVGDDGEGIADDLADRIFEPFFTTRFAGRGMGLAVVAGTVRRHGGVITIESASGRGTTIRLLLPLADTAVPAPPPAPTAPTSTTAAPTAAPTAPMVVLLVDDEDPVREFAALALRRRGHHVVPVARGDAVAAALATIPATADAVAAVDLTMPGVDGGDVVKLLRRERPGLPVVLISGHAGEDLAAASQRLGASGWLAKPFRAAELEHALAAARHASPAGA